MPSPSKILRVLAGFCVTCLVIAAPANDNVARDLIPNYANQLISPYVDGHEPPVLFKRWKCFPIRVAVVEDGSLYSQAIFEAIQKGCQKWTDASAFVPGGGILFTFEHSPNPIGAQVVIWLSKREGFGYEGLTLSNGGWMAMKLSVVDVMGNRIPDKQLQRVVTHEIGHALGISGHSRDERDVMSLTPLCTEVSLADINTLRVAYGGSFAAHK